VRLSPSARSDIREALVWSREHFGEGAAARYQKLIQRAIADIARNPDRPGARERPELAPGIRTYHLFFSRERAGGRRAAVKQPRHFLVYRPGQNWIDVVRVLHDVRDLARHVPEE
jgi:toxin ParE1/3/4